MSSQKQVELDRTQKWVKMLKSWDKYYSGEKLVRRIYKGIPDRLRGEVWGRLLNLNKVKGEQEGVYLKMRNRARTRSTSIRQIDLDVNRTYRNHIMFRERYGVKQQALFHVLAAYSVYNTEVGYCQGMSEIAALLLMYLNEETPFHLTLRLWDIYMLEGDRLLVAMSYCIMKLHRRRLMKMQMEEMSEFLQSTIEKDFGYEDDVVIEQLQVCQEELRKAKMDLPPRPRTNEKSTLPFGLDIQPSVEQLIGRRTTETIDEHFRRNPRGGKAAYLRKKNLNNLGTPEMSRSRGDTRSLQSSRLSNYSIDDGSSYYDTAANSRLSLADHSRASIPSSLHLIR
nr:hypothetical protein BaRGS_025518 [Batillaria attramentaria]